MRDAVPAPLLTEAVRVPGTSRNNGSHLSRSPIGNSGFRHVPEHDGRTLKETVEVVPPCRGLTEAAQRNERQIPQALQLVFALQLRLVAWIGGAKPVVVNLFHFGI